MSETALLVLGAPVVCRDDQPVSLPTKALALLGYLAVQRAPQRREHLLALLWPDSPDDAARKNGRNTLWAIRRALGAESIQTTEDLVSLSPATDVDLWRWEAAVLDDPAAVLSLYRGVLLEGVQLNDAPDFDLWLMLERERLAQSHMRALSAVISAYRQSGRWEDVIAWAGRAVQLDPLQEPLYRALMEAHARLGNRTEALRQYELLQTVLERELDVDPLPETTALLEQIRAGELPLATVAQAAAVAARAHPHVMPKAKTPFIGRAAALVQLDAALAAAQGPQVALISGEIGVGKSRLWSEWLERQAAGLTVLTLRCLQSTQSLPLAPLLDVLSGDFCLRSLFAAPSIVPQVWLAELARLLPEGRMLLPTLPPTTQLPADEERRRTFEALVQAFHALDAPIVLIVDDLHWIDAATCAWLDYATQRLTDRELLLIATYRAEEAPAYLPPIIASWSRRGILRRIPLSRLEPAEAEQLLEQLAVPSDLISQVIEQSGGNPLFLVEWSRTPDASIPPVLADLIAARLAHLPAEAQQVAQAAAVLNPDFALETLRRTSGRSEEEVLDGLDALLSANILAESSDSYTFVHPLIASVVESGMSQARRQFLHKRAATIREQTHAQRLEAIAGRLVTHYRIAGDIYHAAEYADLAADYAQSLAATTEALAFRRTALELVPTPRRQRALGLALLWFGDIVAARAAFEQALKAFAASELHHEVARTCLALAESYLPTADAAQAIAWAERASASLQHCSDPALEAQVLLLLGSSRRIAGQPLHLAEAHLKQAHALASRHGLTGLLARGEFEIGNMLAQRGDLQQALAVFAHAVELAQAARDVFQEVLSHNNLAFVAILAGELALAHTHIEQALSLAQQWSLRLPEQYLLSTRGELALAEHDWTTATDWFERGLQAAESQANHAQIANYHANLGLAARGAGDVERALELLEQAYAAAERLVAPFLQTQIELWLAETLLQNGMPTTARTYVEQAHARLEHSEQGYLKAWLHTVEQQLDHDHVLTKE